LEYSVSTHVIPIGSIGLISSAHFLFLMLIIPSEVNNIPFRALRVGITQSNISIPKVMFSKILIGVLTLIRYLDFSFGKILVTTSHISYITSASSTTNKHPISLPTAPVLAIYSADCARRSLYVDP